MQSLFDVGSVEVGRISAHDIDWSRTGLVYLVNVEASVNVIGFAVNTIEEIALASGRRNLWLMPGWRKCEILFDKALIAARLMERLDLGHELGVEVEEFLVFFDKRNYWNTLLDIVVLANTGIIDKGTCAKRLIEARDQQVKKTYL
jgi:hypothetical protein